MLEALMALVGALTSGGALSALGAAVGVAARWVQQVQIDRHEMAKAEMEHRHQLDLMEREIALAKTRGEIAITRDTMQYEAEALMARAAAAAAEASNEWQAMSRSLSEATRVTGDRLIDRLNGLQRPVVVYGLFLPYLSALFASWAVQVWRGTDALAAFGKTYIGFPEVLLASIAGWLFADRTLRHYRRGG